MEEHLAAGSPEFYYIGSESLVVNRGHKRVCDIEVEALHKCGPIARILAYTILPDRDGMRRPVPPGSGCFRIPIDALDEVQKETGYEKG